MEELNREMADLLLRIYNSDPEKEESQVAMAEIRSVLERAEKAGIIDRPLSPRT